MSILWWIIPGWSSDGKFNAESWYALIIFTDGTIKLIELPSGLNVPGSDWFVKSSPVSFSPDIKRINFP
jgi:hypothetical protein